MPLAVADTGRTNSTSSTSILFFNSSILEFLNSKRSSYLSIRSVPPKRNTSEWMMLLVNASRTAFWCGVSSSRFQVTTKQRNLIANAMCSQLGKSYKAADSGSSCLSPSHLTFCRHRHLHILFFQLRIKSRFGSMILKPDMVQGKGY